jgi:hypothetical protein
MTVFGGRRKSAPGILLAAVAGFSLLATTAANAVVTTTPDAVAFASAITDPIAPAGASFAIPEQATPVGLNAYYDCVADDPSTTDFDESQCPTGVGNTPLAGFPTAGGTYGVLTSGNAALADDPNVSSGSGESWSRAATSIGSGVYDGVVAKIDLPAATTSCLAFDFRFLSDEYPEYVNTNYNDAFIAQLDSWSVTADAATQTVTAPGNFAGGMGDTISVDANGPSAMSDAAALGTTYDGATALLTARVPVAVGSVHSLYLTIFDQGDAILDSAVFLDNLRFETIDAAKCKSLSADPYDGLTGVSPVAGNPPKLSKDKSTLTFPVSCNLPPGPVSCNVTAAAGFIPTPGKVATGRDAALAAVTPLASGSATIAPNTTGAIVMGTTNAGVKAIKTAIKKPAKLKAQAKQLLKKAKKLRAEGKIAKAKKLEAKAAKLIKRAKKLAKKPLGVIKTTITNPANGASQTFKTVLKRP